MRVLGIDFGDRHIGLAVSDGLRLTAQPLETYRIKAGEEDNKRYFLDLVKKYEVGEIVLGNPLRMDGSAGTRAQKTREFADWLKSVVGIPIVLWDERLTSREAQNILHYQKIKRKDQKALEDQVSAAIILSSYLEQKN
jgi:putative Holliday junction resolvase